MKQFNIVRGALALAVALACAGGAQAQENASDRLFRECLAARADNNIGLADELCYKALVHPDFKNVPAEARSQRIYNYAQLKRMLGNWEGAEELLRETLALEEQRAGSTPDLPLARRLAELTIAFAAQGKWPEGLQAIERLMPMADMFQGGERAAVAELFRNYVPQAAAAGRVELARKLDAYAHDAPAPEPRFIER